MGKQRATAQRGAPLGGEEHLQSRGPADTPGLDGRRRRRQVRGSLGWGRQGLPRRGRWGCGGARPRSPGRASARPTLEGTIAPRIAASPSGHTDTHRRNGQRHGGRTARQRTRPSKIWVRLLSLHSVLKIFIVRTLWTAYTF